MDPGFQLLNALLAEMASGLQLTEYRMLEVFCRWLGKKEQAATVIIQYPEKFELRDREQDLSLLKEADGLSVESPTFQKELQKLIASIVLEDDAQLEEINGEMDGGRVTCSEVMRCITSWQIRQKYRVKKR